MSGEEHEVLAIIASRKTANGETEYRIRWKGFDEDGDTWQSGNTIEHTLAFAEYQEKLKNIDSANETTSISGIEQSSFTVDNFSDSTKFKEYHPCPMELILPDLPTDGDDSGFPEDSTVHEKERVQSIKLPKRRSVHLVPTSTFQSSKKKASWGRRN